MTQDLVRVDGLTVAFETNAGATVEVVRNVSLSVKAGENLGLIGESGSGKSMTALALIGLVPKQGRVTAGTMTLSGRPGVVDLSDKRAMASLRGRDIAMVFQDPSTFLNPVLRIHDQVLEAVPDRAKLTRQQRRDAVVELLDHVRIPEAKTVARKYPHELSGGMRQRVLIAMALACKPKLLIADEPTTALDVTVQADILKLIRDLQSELGLAVIFITHDMGVVAHICDRASVMYQGQIVETGPVKPLIANPTHPYSARLIGSALAMEEFEGALESNRGAAL